MESTNIREVISSCVDVAHQVVITVGWYVVGLFVVLLYTGPKIREIYDNWKRKKDDSEYAAQYHKNVDLFQDRSSKLEAARRQLQEKYHRDAEIAKQAELERIERKRQSVLELTKGINSGQKLGSTTGTSGDASTSGSTSSSNSSSLKQGYNPLMGESSRGYRAPKRSCCGKGGCG